MSKQLILHNRLFFLNLMSFFGGFVFYAPVSLLVRTRCGITEAQFFLLEAILSVSIFFFEVPCGLLSDRLGYKNTLIAGSCFLFAARLLIFCSDRFWLFAVEAVAEGIASALAEVTGCFLGSSYKHFGTVKVFGKQGLCDFGTKVSQVNAKGIAASLLDVLERLYHLDFTFHDADRTFIDVLAVVVLDIGLHNRFASVDRKRFREAVAANGYDADFYFGHIIGKHG